jgi:hypothetical protein
VSLQIASLLMHISTHPQNSRQNAGVARSDEDISMIGEARHSSPIIQNFSVIALVIRQSAMQFEACQMALCKGTGCWQYVNLA